MSQETQAVHAGMQRLLHGSLKHIKTAALAAALVPLASVAAQAQTASCESSGGAITGYVWNDANADGLQDPAELPVEGAVVTLTFGTAPDVTERTAATDPTGVYTFWVAPFCTLPYTLSVQVPNGMSPSPADVNANNSDDFDSDGIDDAAGHSVAVHVVDAGNFVLPIDSVDFGFIEAATPPVGTGTPGYWKTHPEAWPVNTITVGGQVYDKAAALYVLHNGQDKDKSVTMFASLVSAMLNVANGTDASCVASAIATGDAWMAGRQPGSNVKASSKAWKDGEPTHRHLDNYNNGMLCAPHRN